MHTCMRCGNVIKTVEQLQGGCSCGSKAFVFTKSDDDIAITSPSLVPAVNVLEKEIGQQEGQVGGLAGNVVQKEIAQAVESGDESGKFQQQANGGEATKQQEGAAQGETRFQSQAQQDAQGANAHAQEEDVQLPPVIEGAHVQDEFFKPIEAEEKKAGFEIENVRLLESGVFEVDVVSLAKNPVVLKDHNDVYYVKLPLAKEVPFFANGKIEKEGKKEIEGKNKS